MLGVYAPCPSNQCQATGSRLWDKTQSWLHSQGITLSPTAYLRDQIQTRTLRHQGRGSLAVPPRHNIAIVAGDFNAEWAGRHGPLPALGSWASAASLISPIASLSTAVTPLHSYYQGGTPKSLIDHILLSQASHGLVSTAGVYAGSFFGSVSDHRPVTLALHLWAHASPILPTTQVLARPATRRADLAIDTPEALLAYQAHLLDHLPPPPTTTTEAGAALQALSNLSAAWTAEQSQPRAHLSTGKRRFDGWSPVAIAIKANLTAIVTIQGHLRGHGSHRPWKTQQDMDRDPHAIIGRRQTTVNSFHWDDPATLYNLLDLTGSGPSFWRTTTLAYIHHPTFCTPLINTLKRLLHGRHRQTLRLHLNAHTTR